MQSQLRDNALPNSGAIISPDGLYRYQLWRIWDRSLPSCMFIMFNPSTADGLRDDPTVRRCIAFAKGWGYGGMWVGNLFALRSTDPDCLLSSPDPVGPHNLTHLQIMTSKSAIVVCAFGNYKILSRLKYNYAEMLQKLGVLLYYIELSINNIPKHPLYLDGTLKPKLWTL
jgi:hypothetical protein